MMAMHYFIPFIIAARLILACTPFTTTFPPGSVSSSSSGKHKASPFVAITPPESFSTGNGLEMFIRRPTGTISRKGGVNSQVAQGATINSTFTLLHGKVTFELLVPSLVPGIVVAVILIADEHDEIDVELLGGDAGHWQSNIYAPSPSDKGPLWGVFGQIHDLRRSPHTISSKHTYAIDWNANRIIWSVDGMAVRTLQRHQTRINGTLHYPFHASRVQLGIWDASSPLGTAQWAKGPVDWNRTPGLVKAVVKNLKVECPEP